MTNESLLNDIYPDVVQNSKNYCRICFRTSKESPLHDGKSLYLFNFFRYSTNQLEFLNMNPDKYENEKVCYMCEAAASAATRFCIAANLSHKLHMLFNKMKQQYGFQRLVLDHLTTPHLQRGESPVKYNNHNVSELQTMLEQYRRKTTLLQSETLLLNSPGEFTEDCVVERSGATLATPATPATRRASRDRLTLEMQSIDERLFHNMNDTDIVTSEIVIEDDDPPDSNVFIIPDEVPASAPPPAPTDTPTDTQTDTPTDGTRYILHPILVNNGTITIPSLDKHITIDDPNFIENGSANNAHISSVQPSITQFLMNQLPQDTKLILSNQGSPNLNFIQNTNSLAQNIVSLVKSQQNTVNFVPNTPKLVAFTQNTSNLSQNTAKSTQTLHSPSLASKPVIIRKFSPVKLTPGPVKIVLSPVKATTSAVKVTSGAVKRPDSNFDSDTYCHTKLPIRKEDGKVDWEDKIPMDVISFVSPSDPAMAVKRQKVGLGGFGASASTVGTPFTDPVDYRDPMDKCVITEVKSVRDEVIDLC